MAAPIPIGTPGVAVFSAGNVATPTNLTPSTGSGYAIGDVLLCFTACRSATPTVATPSGWTLLLNVTGTNGRIALFGKIATSTIEAAPTVAWSGLTTGTSGTPCGARIQAFRGLSLDVDVTSTIQNGAASTTASASGNAMTIVSADDLALCLSTRLDDVGTWSAPTSLAMINANGSTSGADFTFAWAYGSGPAVGSFAPVDFGLSGAVSFASSGIAIALKAKVVVTQYGVVALPVSFNAVVSGSRKVLGQVVFPLTFIKEVQAQRKTFSLISYNVIFGKDVKGNITLPPAVTYYGAISQITNFSAIIQAQRKAFGQLALPITFSKEVQAQRKTFGQLLSPLIFGKAVAGYRKTFSQTAFPINVGIATSGFRVGLTLYGSLTLPVIFSKDVNGQRKAFGQLAVPLIFTKDVRGQRTTFSQLSFPIIFTKEAVGRKQAFGQLSMPTIFGKEITGNRKTFSQLSVPLVFVKDVRGYRKTFSHVAFPIDVMIVVAGRGTSTYYGSFSMPLTFDKQVSAYRRTFGQVTSPFLFGSASQGWRRAFGELELPIDFVVNVETGLVEVHGQIALDILVAFETVGRVKPKGIVLNLAEMIYLGNDPVQAVYVDDQKVWP